MKPPLSTAAPTSLTSFERIEPPGARLETFEEKTQRFNEYEEITTHHGHAFHVQEPRIINDFDWQPFYLVEMDLVEQQEQYLLPFGVAIYWEEMFGDERPPSESLLFRLARTVVGEYLESHRTERKSSCHTYTIRLRLPEYKPKHDIHPHNY